MLDIVCKTRGPTKHCAAYTTHARALLNRTPFLVKSVSTVVLYLWKVTSQISRSAQQIGSSLRQPAEIVCGFVWNFQLRETKLTRVDFVHSPQYKTNCITQMQFTVWSFTSSFAEFYIHCKKVTLQESFIYTARKQRRTVLASSVSVSDIRKKAFRLYLNPFLLSVLYQNVWKKALVI